MKKLEDFTQDELVERKSMQATLHDALMALKTALDARQFEKAILLNINGSRILKTMVAKGLTLAGEEDMLETLHNNVLDILRLQHRHQ